MEPLWSVVKISKHNLRSVWPYLAIYRTLGNFSKPLTLINVPKSPTFLGNFWKGGKIFMFLVKSFLGNFNRHLATFYWSHCQGPTYVGTFYCSLYITHANSYKCIPMLSHLLILPMYTNGITLAYTTNVYLWYIMLPSQLCLKQPSMFVFTFTTLANSHTTT